MRFISFDRLIIFSIQTRDICQTNYEKKKEIKIEKHDAPISLESLERTVGVRRF